MTVMERIKMSDEIYKSEHKEEFLNKESKKGGYLEKDTKDGYRRLFKALSKLERKYKKDLFDFNEEQLAEAMKELNPRSEIGARSNGRIISSYIDFAIEKGWKEDSENLLDRDQEYFKKFATNTDKLYLTYKDLLNIEVGLYNRQDSVIFRLLFEGAQGHALSELINLTEDDVKKKIVDGKEQYYLVLRDDKKEKPRDMDISKRAYNLIKKAMMETEYFKNNGSEVNGKQRKIQLVDTPHVLKTGITQKSTNSSEKISKFSIHNRIEKSRQGYEKEFITAKNIVKSGMLYKAKQLYLEDGEFGDAQITKVCEQFGVKPSWSIKDFLTLDNIKKLYPEVK